MRKQLLVFEDDLIMTRQAIQAGLYYCAEAKLTYLILYASETHQIPDKYIKVHGEASEEANWRYLF